MLFAKDTRVYLASRSPRRRELLRQIGVGYDYLPLREKMPRGPDVDESVLPGESPEVYVRRVSLAKANTGWTRVVERGLPRLPVLAADTTVCLGETIYGKPADAADAARMLAELSGTVHKVLSAVTLRFERSMETALSVSTVRFRPLSEDDIRRYVDTGEPMDKAGAYGIQGLAAVFIQELQGSYTGVMGLPLFETAELLTRFSGAGTR